MAVYAHTIWAWNQTAFNATVTVFSLIAEIKHLCMLVPPLRSTLKYLSSFWMDLHDILSRFSWFPNRTNSPGEPLTFISTTMRLTVCGFDWHNSSTILWTSINFGRPTDIHIPLRMSYNNFVHSLTFHPGPSSSFHIFGFQSKYPENVSYVCYFANVSVLTLKTKWMRMLGITPADRQHAS